MLSYETGRALLVPTAEQLDEAQRRVAGLSGIDAGIVGAVIQLQARGIPTIGSCAGHPADPDRSFQPWITIGAPPSDWRNSCHPDDWHGLAAQRQAHDTLMADLIVLCRTYYAEVGFPADQVMLTSTPLDYAGRIILQCTGLGASASGEQVLGDYLGAAGRQAWWARTSLEMNGFCDWLTGRKLTRRTP